MLLSVTRRKGQRRKGQPDPDLHAVQNPEHALVRNKQEGAARCWLTVCSTPRACSCQQQAGKTSQILTYTLFNTQSMLLSVTSRKNQSDADLHSVQKPEHALVSNEQEEAVRSWLTRCLKPRACFCQQRAERSSQVLTYMLFKTQSMLSSETSRKSQPNADLQTVQKPEQLLSATSRKGQPDPDSHTVQNPEHALVSNYQEGPARSWLTICSTPRACSCQQQAGRASQILTYKLFKTQSMSLSATNRKGQPAPDLHAVQNPEHALVSNKQERPARSWLTSCSKPSACSC